MLPVVHGHISQALCHYSFPRRRPFGEKETLHALNVPDSGERVVQRISVPSFVEIGDLGELSCMSLILCQAAVVENPKPREMRAESKTLRTFHYCYLART